MAEIPNGPIVHRNLSSETVWKEHSGGVKSIAVSPDGLWIAAADTLRQIVLWRLGQVVRQFEPFAFWELYPAKRQIFDLEFSNDSSTLFVAASDRICAYSNESGRRLWRFRGPPVWTFLPSNPLGLAVNPVNGELAAGYDDGHMGFWTPEGRALGFWFDDQGPRRLGFTRDGAQLIGSDLHSICIWDAASHTKVARHLSQKQVHALAVSKVDEVAATSDLYELTIWRHESGAECARLPVEPGLPLIAFSPSESVLAYANGASVHLCDFNGSDLASLDLDPIRPLSLAFEAAGRWLLVGASDGAIRHFPVPGS